MHTLPRSLRAKFILPALTEATSPYWRPIKYSLFPPLGLATLAAYLRPDDEAVIVDEHVGRVYTDDYPDLVIIQVYITNAKRAYAMADAYRTKGVFVALGGLHVTSLPDEAAAHADAIFLGPGEQTFPQFLEDFRSGQPLRRYVSTSGRTLERVPPIRRDLIRRHAYLVPNSIVVTRGCPQHCDFCYKDAFFEGGRSFYTQRVDDALAEIERLPGRHLYFLDDHLFGDRRFASALFDGMRGMGRLFQGAATVDSILRGDLVERAAEAGLRSLFVGFETLAPANLVESNKRQNLGRDYAAVARRLHDLGIMINGSFVFGMDDDDESVFTRTVDWGIEHGLTTATFHIQTPYPGTRLFARMEAAGRILTHDWDLYDTRHVIYRPARLTPEALKRGYDNAYRDFYRWSSIVRGSLSHDSIKHQAKHFFYAVGWKKFEPLWDMVIRAKRLAMMTPLLEGVLSKVTVQRGEPLAAGEMAPASPVIALGSPIDARERQQVHHRERTRVPLGSVGRQRGFRARYEWRSALSRPRNTSVTMRAPTPASTAPPASSASLRCSTRAACCARSRRRTGRARQLAGASGRMPMALAMSWPDGSDQVRCRSRLRCGNEVGGSPLAIAPSGRVNSGVEILVSINLFGRTSVASAPPKLKNVCQPTKRRGARQPPRRSIGSGPWPGRIEDEREERPTAVAEHVGAVRRPDDTVAESIGGRLELDRNARVAGFWPCRNGRLWSARR